MKTGISLHIGLNFVDPNHYSGWDGKLNAAENDAEDMAQIAKACGFDATKLIREQAKREVVKNAVSNAASQLKPGDIFFISYSGHGGQLPDQNGDEDDGMDETWCLYDGELIDDELSVLWSAFQKGVRILVISDSCRSGSVIKMAKAWERDSFELPPRFVPKYMPSEIATSTYFHNKKFYDGIMRDIKNVKSKLIQASVKLISGCQDNQFSYDGPFNGQFTCMLKKVWNGGKFSGNYLSFHKRIMQLLPQNQTPNYFNIGPINQSFDDEKPFTIQLPLNVIQRK